MRLKLHQVKGTQPNDNLIEQGISKKETVGPAK